MTLLSTIVNSPFFLGFGVGYKFTVRLTADHEISEDKNGHQKLTEYAGKVKQRYISKLTATNKYNPINYALFRVGFTMGSD